jgi:GNAT superfamily N-acetyltransferase
MTRSNSEFQQGNGEYSYTFHPAPDEDASHIIKANFQGTPIGFLKWDAGHGEVTDLEVRDSHRRKGVATEMWNQAKAHSAANGLISPQHSSARTRQGSAWANSLGKDRPRSPEDNTVPYIRRGKKDFLNMSESHNA